MLGEIILRNHSSSVITINRYNAYQFENQTTLNSKTLTNFRYQPVGGTALNFDNSKVLCLL